MTYYDAIFYSEDDVIRSELEEIRNLENAVIEFVNKLYQLGKYTDTGILQDFIQKEAFNAASEYISKFALQYVLNAAKRALYETVEYNYEPFVARLEQAIIAHADEILFITFGNTINVKLDLSPLGSLEEYQNAVEQAREIGNFGLDESNPLMGWFWQEKVYKPAREGVPVPEDDTGKYGDAYGYTIELRLSLISQDRAPFWYLVNYGNLSATGMRHMFDPYPIVAPTNFVERAEIAIRTAFLEAFERFKSVAGDAVVEDIFTILGITGYGASIENLDFALAEYFDKAVSDPVTQQKIKDADVNKLTHLFTQGNIEYSARKSSKGRLYLVGRDIRTQRFTSILSKR